MSDWTYVRGSLELGASPFDKKRVLPYPEEQFKLGSPIVRQGVLSFDGTCIYSLPRVKKYIDEAFKLFPQGELGFRYWVDQKDSDCRCYTSGFDLPCLCEYYRNAINKLYSSLEARWGEKWNYDTLKEYNKIEEECSYSSADTILCGIYTSLRYATAEEVKDSLIKFIDHLKEHDISIDGGYLEWYDSYSNYAKFIYAFRTGEWLGEYSIMKLDKETNKIIWQLKHAHPKNKNGKGINFKTFVDIEEDFTNKEE